MRPNDVDADYEDDEDADFGPRFDEPRPPEPPRRSGIPRWLIVLGVVFVIMPLSCCGGLLLWSSTFKDFKLSNGQHLGGSAMNVKFDYEIKRKDFVMHDAYFIVAQTADDVTRERNLHGRFATRGTLHFTAIDAGPAEPKKSPVKVWIEKEGMRGGRSRASNVISIELKTAK